MSYHENITTSYPVVYMPAFEQRYRNGGDEAEMGDQVFGAASWDVETTMDQVTLAGEQEAIIVVVYALLPELTPWENTEFVGTGNGDAFLTGMINDVVPFINTNYRTLTDVENTSIAGGGYAGLFALYAALEKQDLFSSCALFSPALWLNAENLTTYLNSWEKTTLSKLYFTAGAKEMPALITQVELFFEQIANKGFSEDDAIFALYPDAQYDDVSWGKQYKNAFNFMMGDAYDTPPEVVIEDPSSTNPVPEASSLIAYKYMSSTLIDDLTCDVSAGTEILNYSLDGTNINLEEVVLLLEEIPASVKVPYYWNLNAGADCLGDKFYDTDRSVAFKSSKTKDSWLRCVIHEDGQSSSYAVSSSNFRVTTTSTALLMSRTKSDGTEGSDDSYTVAKEVSFGENKSFTVNYGSVNSGSDMGSLVASKVSDSCLKAQIIYSFKYNTLLVKELEFGSADVYPVVESFRSTPSFVNLSNYSITTVSAFFEDLKDYDISYRIKHNYGTAFSIDYTIEDHGEHIFDIPDRQEGIYYIYMDVEKDGVMKQAYKYICVKVLDIQRTSDSIIFNPYEGVNWDNEQYKANLHTHTSQSFDVTQVTSTQVVDAYHSKGYKILALTDHDYNTYPWTHLQEFNPEVENRSPEDLDMLSIPGIELSKDNRNEWSDVNGNSICHHNDYFTGRAGQEFASLEESIAYTDSIGGFQTLNHPGQYWKISTNYTASMRNSPDWYANLFKKHKSLLGLGVYVQGDKWTKDRVLWDQVLDLVMLERPVFAYSSDDSHNPNQWYGNYTYWLMDDLSIESLKLAMKKGSFYCSSQDFGTGEALAPKVSGVHIDKEAQTITIDTDAKDVYWICSTDTRSTASTTKSSVMGYGKIFYYEGFQGKYIRAFLKNAYGETCVQPFGFDPTFATSVDESTSEDAVSLITLYPNPTNTVLNIETGPWAQHATIYLEDPSGRQLKSIKVQDYKTIIDVSLLNPGVYFIRIDDEVARFIKGNKE